jgi:hypothetical protein
MSNDISNVLQIWYDSKQKIKELEKKCDKCKKIIGNVMDNKKTNVISKHKYEANRRHDKRRILSKKNMSEQVYMQYSNEISIDSYFIKKKKEVE